MLNIAVLVSGVGTNLQALLDAKRDGKIPDGRFALVLSSRPDAYALTRAKSGGLPTVIVARSAYASKQAFDQSILAVLREHCIDVLVLAGFMCILGQEIIRAYNGRILNVHPSLIPAFCGEGYYGLKVHQAALDRGVKVTGATVHLVNETPDGGKILLQKAVDILPGDTPQTLQRRVMEQAEWVLLPQAVQQLCALLKGKKGETHADS